MNKNYIENPKTKDSGIICCIPQKGVCPMKCPDCFFQGGKSYLEPLNDNLPNMPSLKEVGNKIVRVNDGNDSCNNIDLVIKSVKKYKQKFYNTSIYDRMKWLKFDAPVVFTCNPGIKTDVEFNLGGNYDNFRRKLMFVRIRTNTWNLENVVDKVIKNFTHPHYNISVVLTFMAYYDEKSIPEEHRKYYVLRKRTLNSYYAITTAGWEMIMSRYKYNINVYSCGKVEGELGKIGCSKCGNCIREYFNAIERMKKNQ
jgi:hypothetical protein